MVTDSKELTSIDPKDVEKVIKDQDTTLTFGKPIEIKKDDVQLLSKIGEQQIDQGILNNNIEMKDLSNFPDLESFITRFDSPVFRGLVGIGTGLSMIAEAPYQCSRIIERVRIERITSIIEAHKFLNVKEINKWVLDPNKFLGDVNPKCRFLTVEEILKGVASIKAPNLLIEESPIVQSLAGQAALGRTIFVGATACAFFKLAICGEIFKVTLKPSPEVPPSLIETNKSQIPSVMKINTEVVSEIGKNKGLVEKPQIAELPAIKYNFEFDFKESGSNKDDDHLLLSEVDISLISEIDSNLISESTEVKRQLEDQQVPSEVQYSETLTQSASNDSSVGCNSPGRGSKSKRSDD